MTQDFRFQSFCCSKSLFLLLVGGMTLFLQTGDNPAINAREYVEADQPHRGLKADRWMGPETRPGIYGTRLSHLWDGTPENKLNEMVAPQPDRMMLAYAPEILVQQNDAVQALRVFDEPVKIADNAPMPLPRPGEKELAASAAKKAGVPMALLSNLPKTTASIKAPAAPAAEERTQVASLAPAIMPQTAPQETTVTALNLPYTLQIPSVQTGCFPAQLVSLIGQIEQHYNKKVVITSGYRTQKHARTGSLHVHCAAADIIVPGVSGAQLASYAKTIPGIGGVGQYCHPSMIHVDIGRQRDWHFGCSSRAKKKPAGDDHDA
ncbi:MAG: D-Ala-D-Ala carboxypeptidase family metallohydrolase [Pseudomonadota bacterium]